MIWHRPQSNTSFPAQQQKNPLSLAIKVIGETKGDTKALRRCNSRYNSTSASCRQRVGAPFIVFQLLVPVLPSISAQLANANEVDISVERKPGNLITHGLYPALPDLPSPFLPSWALSPGPHVIRLQWSSHCTPCCCCWSISVCCTVR
jgi:hypothetical protein